MIGRNDPCTCGSGKKYKKCCLGKNEVAVEQLIDDELERVLLGVYEQSKERADIAEYNRYRRQWVEKLGSLWDEKSIEVSVTEYFLFVARHDIWNNYLSRLLNGQMRSTVRSVVESWQKPFVLFAKIIGEKDGFVEVQEILGEETYYLEKGKEMPVGKDAIVFGVVLHDNRSRENGLYVITSLMFVQDDKQYFKNEITSLVKSSQIEESNDFYKEHMLDVYEIMLSPDNGSIDELIDNDLTKVQQEALTMIDEVLEDVKVQPEAHELLKNIGITYFLKEQPNFRKPNVVAAAVFLVAIDLKMLGELTMTNAEVAKLFDVSTASIKKHAENIHKFVVEMIAQTK